MRPGGKRPSKSKGPAFKPTAHKVMPIRVTTYAGRIAHDLQQLSGYVNERSHGDSFYRGLGERDDARLIKIETALTENRQVRNITARQMLADIRAIMKKHLIKPQ